MRRELERQSAGLLPRTGQGSSPWRRTSFSPSRGGNGLRTGLRNRSPQGMSFDSDRVTSGWPCACGIAPELNRARALKSLPSRRTLTGQGFGRKSAPPVCGIRIRPWVSHVPRRWNRLMPGHQWIAPRGAGFDSWMTTLGSSVGEQRPDKSSVAGSTPAPSKNRSKDHAERAQWVDRLDDMACHVREV